MSTSAPSKTRDVTDVNVARRLINYSALIEEIVGRLATDGIADTKGLRATHGYNRAGRYLRIHAKFVLWVGVHLEAWRAWGVTPIWWQQNADSPESGIKGQLRQTLELFDDALEAQGMLFIPIRLTTGVERDRVIDDAAQQMRTIADRLLETFPGG